MAFQPTEWIWHDGKLVPWDQATLHVAAHVVHYGSSVFEGIRAYRRPGGSAIFCLDEHLDRLWTSAQVFRLPIPFTRQQYREAIIQTVKANGQADCYIRPVIFRGVGTIAVDGRACPTHVSIITLPMGKYLGDEAAGGVDVGVSSWRRMAPNTYPAAAKIGGQYVNSQFVVMEATDRGFVEGIALDVNGFVSEGSGENIFVARHGRLLTPPLSSSILDGITRRCVIALAAELGLPVLEETIPRELLYLADELFFTGTAAEITPIRSVDGLTVGDNCPGPITARLMSSFFDIVEGRVPDRHRWLTPVE